MNVEIWDLYDAQGEKTGKTMIRGEAIPVRLLSHRRTYLADER